MTVFPIFIPNLGCPNSCIYCNQQIITKKKEIIWKELHIHIQKIYPHFQSEIDEIAFFGGTFSNLNLSLQAELLQQPFPDKICHFRFSTRPDSLSESLLTFYKNNQVKTIELGVQSFSDSVLAHTKRSYTADIAEHACRLIKKYGFQLCIQLMPGLPGYCDESIAQTITKTIELKPDFVRIYPTVILRDTELEKMYRQGQYQPLSLADSIELSAKMKLAFEANQITVIKIGLHSDIAAEDIVSGQYHHSFGELVKAHCLVEKIYKNYQKHSVLSISPKDVSLFKGNDKMYLRKLKKKLAVSEIEIFLDTSLPSEAFRFLPKHLVKKIELW